MSNYDKTTYHFFRSICRLGMILSVIWISVSCDRPTDAQQSNELPPIYPDYTEVTIPVNIAPLNFLFREGAEKIEVVLKTSTESMLIRSKQKIQFPEHKWRNLLESDSVITVQVSAKIDGGWIQYAPFKWRVVEDKVDPYLSYRLIEPGYEVWNTIQLRERNLENFKERVIADNNLTNGSCMNCHIYGNQRSDLSFFHLRGKQGGTVLNRDGKLRKLNTKAGDMVAAAVYGDLHPSGRYGIFSSNIIIPAFHAFRSERLEVYDTESEIYLLDFEENKVMPVPVFQPEMIVAGEDSARQQASAFRTFPVFAADGKSIYYCEAPAVELPQQIKQLMYSLYKLDFNPADRNFGSQVDTLFNAQQVGKSVCHPKASPDGNYLLYTVADFGTFPIWHREADLQLLNLHTGVVDSLQVVNSSLSDTYHSWSSNSRWFVFASKRDDGLYGKPYFCYIDATGKAHKPFVLPQQDPAFYDYTLKSFNIPELSTGQLPFDAIDIEKVYHNLEAESFSFSNK